MVTVLTEQSQLRQRRSEKGTCTQQLVQSSIQAAVPCQTEANWELHNRSQLGIARPKPIGNCRPKPIGNCATEANWELHRTEANWELRRSQLGIAQPKPIGNCADRSQLGIARPKPIGNCTTEANWEFRDRSQFPEAIRALRWGIDQLGTDKKEHHIDGSTYRKATTAVARKSLRPGASKLMGFWSLSLYAAGVSWAVSRNPRNRLPTALLPTGTRVRGLLCGRSGFARCHAEIAETFSHHPMAHSMTMPEKALPRLPAR